MNNGSSHLCTNWRLAPGDKEFHKAKLSPPTQASTSFSCFNSICVSGVLHYHSPKNPPTFFRGSVPSRGRTGTGPKRCAYEFAIRKYGEGDISLSF